MYFPVHFAVGCKFFLTHRVFGSFSHVVRAVLTVMFWGCCFPCVLLAVVFNFVLSHCGFPIRGLSFRVLGLCIVAIVLL